MHGPIGDGEQGLTGSQRFDDKELEELLAVTLQTEPLDAEVQEYVRLFKEVSVVVRADDMRFRSTHAIAIQFTENFKIDDCR